MSLKTTILLLFAWYVSVFGGRILSREEDLEFEKELQRLTKPAIETIQTTYGDVYDCVDFYQQSVFDNPLLKNHSFHPEMKPTSYPRGKGKEVNYKSPFGAKTLWANGKGCPIGSVPIRRITKDDLIKAKTAGEMYASNLNIQNAERPGFYFGVLHTQHDQQNKLKYYGAGMKSALYNPKLNAASQYSSSQLKIQNGQENIIVGWTVHPGVYPDSQTRFFIYTNAKDKHCFNNFCELFIQVRADIPLDFVFTNISQIGVSTLAEPFFIYRDVANGNWFLEIGFDANDHIIVGWWPSKVFTGLANFGSYIEWGGEVYTPDHVPAPDMGSGQFAVLNNRFVATCSNLKTINEANQIVDALNLVSLEDKEKYYYVRDAGYYSSQLQHLMFYGGKGRVKR
ncbi:hypothetical protein M5689_008059 [Euphorbia peplus]|nr:hypothetical protein M5689_008059 [Euphorbia peplus]